MGDRIDRARAVRGLSVGVLLGLLSAAATIALAIAIPTQGENPSAWGVIGCGAITGVLCGQLALRNWRRLRHFRGADLPPPHAQPRRTLFH